MTKAHLLAGYLSGPDTVSENETPRARARARSSLLLEYVVLSLRNKENLSDGLPISRTVVISDRVGSRLPSLN